MTIIMDKKTRQTVKQHLRKTIRVARRGAESGAVMAKGYAAGKIADIQRSRAPLSSENWYGRVAASCEGVSDVILHDKPGTSQRIVKAAAGKLGTIGVPAAIFSTAAVLGTASTGTAIGSLSGAAFTSAALAWVGGSVAVGGVILAVAGLAGGVGAVIGTGWATKKYLFGKERSKSELDEQERRILDASLALALAFRSEEQAGRSIDPLAANALYAEALKPLCDELLDYRYKIERWPYLARKRFRDVKDRLESTTSFAHRLSRKYPNLATGIVGAVITQLLADEIPNFDENEEIVLDALRRSNKSLEAASDEELAAYVQSLEPMQLRGLSNNLLGISHELRYYVQENNDGDEYAVELFEATNHPGADVRILNTASGEIREVQLKAANYQFYIEQHTERYANIPVMATDELANRMDGVESTEISHKDLSDDVDSVVYGLRDVDDPSVLSSMSVAGMIALARNVNVLLKGKAMKRQDKKELVRDGARSALISGLVHTVIG